MLTCVYHPIDPMRVLEEGEANQLKASGVWFDCPAKAKAYRLKVEEEIKNDALEVKTTPKAKLKGKRNERQ